MRTVIRTLAFVACVLACALRPAEAHDVGDLVVPTAAIDLKVRDRVVESVDTDDVLTVQTVQDTWLWVSTASGTKGWIKADAVEPYEAGATPLPSPGEADRPELPEAALAPDSDRLYLIGALGGAHVYTTYAYIGVLADGLSKELYSAEQTKTLLGEVVSVSDSLIKNLTRVRDGGLSASDTKAVDQLLEIYSLLQDEARAASAFTDTRSVDDAEKFEQARLAAWPKIAELLGIDAEPVEAADATE